MTQVMQYDDAFTNKLLAIYSTPDVMAQRDTVFAHAKIQSGEHALDIGTGPGLTTHAIGRCVGSSGSVIGIDISDNALAIAREQCAALPWVEFEKCDATDLPFADSTFDVAISTQVYEYIQDIDIALSELYRVLRSGGRAVILDSDWDSCVWHTRNRERMHHMIDLWNTHCSHPFLPRTLKQHLLHAGFDIVSYDVHTLLNPHYDPNTYSYGIIDFISSYLNSRDRLSDRVVAEWATELHELGKNGEYFFSLNRYIFVVHKRD